MDFIFELIGEILFDLFFWFLDSFFKTIENDPRTRKTLKIIFSSLVFIASLILFILAIVYKTYFYLIAVSIYFFLVLLFSIIRFICVRKKTSTHLTNYLSLSLSILHFVFPIILIFLACVYPNQAFGYVLGFSIGFLCIYLCIGIYHLYTHPREKKYKNFEKKMVRFMTYYQKQERETYLKTLVALCKTNPNNRNTYLTSCKEEEFLFYIQNLLPLLLKEKDSSIYLTEVRTYSTRFDSVVIRLAVEAIENKQTI